MTALLALTLVFGGSALAQEDIEPSVDGKELPALGEIPEGKSLGELIVEYQNREYEPQAYWAEEQLGITPKYAHDIRAGLELIFQRQYSDARAYFVKLDEDNPDGVPLASAMDSLIWQALMLENFDFKYEKQWEVSSRSARQDLLAAIDKPGNQALEYFIMAGMVGIESIHTMRREKYLPALQLAFEAMDWAEKSRAEAPTFVDLKLADGMYNYWRTVVTMASPLLPDFGDHRIEGIEQMQEVENAGVFLAPAATLSLVFTWLEEKETKRALAGCLRNQRAYPDNVINNLVLGQTYTYMRKFKLATETYDRILATDAQNKRVHYWRGVSLLRSGHPIMAEESLNTYLGFDYLEEWQRSAAHYRLGQVYNRQKKYAEAEAEFKKSVKLTGHKAAKNALDRLKKRKKDGQIDY